MKIDKEKKKHVMENNHKLSQTLSHFRGERIDPDPQILIKKKKKLSRNEKEMPKVKSFPSNGANEQIYPRLSTKKKKRKLNEKLHDKIYTHNISVEKGSMNTIAGNKRNRKSESEKVLKVDMGKNAINVDVSTKKKEKKRNQRDTLQDCIAPIFNHSGNVHDSKHKNKITIEQATSGEIAVTEIILGKTIQINHTKKRKKQRNILNEMENNRLNGVEIIENKFAPQKGVQLDKAPNNFGHYKIKNNLVNGGKPAGKKNVREVIAEKLCIRDNGNVCSNIAIETKKMPKKSKKRKDANKKLELFQTVEKKKKYKSNVLFEQKSESDLKTDQICANTSIHGKKRKRDELTDCNASCVEEILHKSKKNKLKPTNDSNLKKVIESPFDDLFCKHIKSRVELFDENNRAAEQAMGQVNKICENIAKSFSKTCEEQNGNGISQTKQNNSLSTKSKRNRTETNKLRIERNKECYVNKDHCNISASKKTSPQSEKVKSNRIKDCYLKIKEEPINEIDHLDDKFEKIDTYNKDSALDGSISNRIKNRIGLFNEENKIHPTIRQKHNIDFFGNKNRIKNMGVNEKQDKSLSKMKTVKASETTVAINQATFEENGQGYINGIKLSVLQLESIKGLSVSLPFDPHPVHMIETKLTNRPKPLQRKAMEELGYALITRSYNTEEDGIIKLNWKEFCQRHILDEDPGPFLVPNKYFPYAERRKFVQYLARGLEHRTLASVLKRFRLLFSTHLKKGKFTREEDDIILEYINKIEQEGYSKKDVKIFAHLASILKRERLQIEKHYITISKEQKPKLINKDGDKLIRNLLLLFGMDNVEELKDCEITLTDWKNMEKLMNHPYNLLKAVWRTTLYPKLFYDGDRNVFRMRKEIMQILLEQKESDWKVLDWEIIAKSFKGQTASGLYKSFKNLVYSKVPKSKWNDLAACISHLNENYFNNETTKETSSVGVLSAIIQDKNGVYKIQKGNRNGPLYRSIVV